MTNKKEKIVKEYLTGKYTTKELSEKIKNKNGEPMSQRYIQMTITKNNDVNMLGRTAHVPIFSALDLLYISENPTELYEVMNRKYKEYYIKRTKKELKYELDHWQREIRRMKLRALVMQRDDYKCCKCNSSIALEVHHKKPAKTHPDLEFEVDNCVTLCKLHHVRNM